MPRAVAYRKWYRDKFGAAFPKRRRADDSVRVVTTTTRSIDNTQKTVADETSGQEYLKQKEEEERMKREEEEAAMHAKELADEVIADTVAGFDKVDALREKAMEILMMKRRRIKKTARRK